MSMGARIPDGLRAGRARGIGPVGTSRGFLATILFVLVALGHPGSAGAQEFVDELGGERFRVRLRNGDVLEGRVFDLRDEKLEIIRKLGRVTVPKRDVTSWAPLAGLPEDENPMVIVLRTGQEIYGQVTREPGEWRIDVAQGSQRFADADVQRVVYADGNCSDGSFTPRVGFLADLNEAIAQVQSDDEEARQLGKSFVERCGYFALPSLEKAMDASDPGGRLARVALEERIRVALPADVNDVFPSFLTVLREGEETTRRKILREAFMEYGEDLFPFLGVILLDEEQPASVRGLAVDVLQRMNCLEELVDAYQTATGQAQLAVAIALGDAGIFIGIPTLLEALELDDPSARNLAATKLEEYTGENFGYRPQGTVEENRTALSRWRGWWRNNHEQIENLLGEHLQNDARHRSPQRRRAVGFWREGNLSWQEKEIVVARELYKKASETDPTYAAPLVSLGILAYREEGDFVAAIDLLRRALRRGNRPVDDQELRRAYYHLGRIHQLGFDFELAAKAYIKAVDIDKSFADAWYNLGSCYYDAAIRMRRSTTQERVARFREAADAFSRGRENLRQYRDSLVVLTSRELPIGSDLPFSRREYNIGLMQLRDQLTLMESRFSFRLGVVHLALGEKAEALAAAEEALAGPTPESRYHQLHANVLEALGRMGEANRARARAKELGASSPRSTPGGR